MLCVASLGLASIHSGSTDAISSGNAVTADSCSNMLCHDPQNRGCVIRSALVSFRPA